MKVEDFVHNNVGRNGGVECLRVLCMFGFVCLHVIGYSSIAPFGSVDVQNTFLLHLRYLLNIGVDVYAFISGFYGIKFSIRKAFNLLFIGLFSSLVVFFIEILFFDIEFRVISIIQIFFNNWYFREYLILFLLASFLNDFFDDNDIVQYKKIIIPLTLLFIWNFLATQFPSSLGQTHSLGNHSAILLIIMYLLGRLLNKSGFLQKINLKILILLFTICIPFLFFFSRLKDFSSPFCIIAAISLFELFRRMKIPYIINRIACFLSPSMLGVLILHNAGSHKISGGLVYRFFENYTGDLTGILVFKYSLIIFTCSLFIDFLRRFFSLVIKKMWGGVKK